MGRPGWIVAAVLLAGCGDKSSKPNQGAQPPPLAIASNRAALEVVSGDGQLGTADFGDKRQCVFSLKNNTSQPMRLSMADKSCTCAGTRVEPEVIEPGQAAAITLLWTPKAEVLESTVTRIWAEVRDASGAAKVRLEAMGTLEPKVQFAFPRGPLDFGRLDLAELENSAKVLVVEAYSTKGKFDVSSFRSTLEGIQVVGMPEPLPADKLAQLQAQAGYRFSIRPAKGLPTGRFQGHVQLVTSFSPAPLELPVVGSFEAGIVSLSQDRIELPPRLKMSEGYRVPAITVTVRQGTCAVCDVESVSPALFEAKVTKTGEKTWRVEVSFDAAKSKLSPEQWKELTEFGFEQGQVTLRLDHAEVKTVQIPISGAVIVK
jgi:hypothetical protein